MAWAGLRFDVRVRKPSVGKFTGFQAPRVCRSASLRHSEHHSHLPLLVGRFVAVRIACLPHITMAVVTRRGLALEDAAEHLRSHKVVALAAVEENGWALRHAAEDDMRVDMRVDKEVVLAAVAQCGEALKHADSDLQADKEVVLTAVADDADALQYAAGILRADEEMVLAAVAQNGLALQYAASQPSVAKGGPVGRRSVAAAAAPCVADAGPWPIERQKNVTGEKNTGHTTMRNTEFASWLAGFVLVCEPSTLSEAQFKCIENHAKLCEYTEKGQLTVTNHMIRNMMRAISIEDFKQHVLIQFETLPSHSSEEICYFLQGVFEIDGRDQWSRRNATTQRTCANTPVLVNTKNSSIPENMLHPLTFF